MLNEKPSASAITNAMSADVYDCVGPGRSFFSEPVAPALGGVHCQRGRSPVFQHTHISARIITTVCMKNGRSVSLTECDSSSIRKEFRTNRKMKTVRTSQPCHLAG